MQTNIDTLRPGRERRVRRGEGRMGRRGAGEGGREREGEMRSGEGGRLIWLKSFGFKPFCFFWLKG